jgi:methionine-rich copper-binding protein CopC/uncharacterized membrane protein
MLRRRCGQIRLPVFFISLLALFCSMAFLPSVAYAHAYVIGSDPIDGSTVQAVPHVIRIYFDTAISPVSVAHLFHTENNDFVEVATPGSFVVPTNNRELDIPLPSASTMPQGSYFVRWTALADDDGHTTYGAIGFDVGYSATGLSGTPTLGPTTSNALDDIRTLDAIGILSVAWQWLTLVALAFWLGLLVTERLVLARMEHGLLLLASTHKQSLSLQWLCLTALLIGEVVSLALSVLRFTQVTTSGLDVSLIGQLLGSTFYSQLWFVRVLLLLAAMALLYWTNRPQSQQAALDSRKQTTRSMVTDAVSTPQARITRDFSQAATTVVVKEPIPTGALTAGSTMRLTWLWLPLTAAIALTMTLSSDIADVIALPISAIVLLWCYLLAQGAWFGSLAYLSYVLLPIIRREQLTDTLIVLLRRLNRFLLASIGIFLVSGLFLGEATLHTPAQLLNDPYGRTLLAAMVLTALVTLLSLYLFSILRVKFTRQALLLPVVDAELPARRTRQSALEATERQFQRGAGGVSLCAAAIVLCYALMSFYAPPVVFPDISYSNPAPPTNPSVGKAQIQNAGPLTIMLQVLPGKASATTTNTIIVIITDSTGAPVTNATVLLRLNMEAMDMGTAHTTLNGGSPAYVTTFTPQQSLNMSGVWDILVTVERPGLPAEQALFPVTLS